MYITRKIIQDARVKSTQEVNIASFNKDDPHKFWLKAMSSNTMFLFSVEAKNMPFFLSIK